MSSSSNSNGVLKPLYMYIEEAEPLERYRTGGYHPTAIGDRLNNRYHIVHKLGFGTNSTTWLAQDEKTVGKPYVAVKISVAQNEHSQRENDTLRLLRDQTFLAHPGSAIIPILLDELEIHGPNGRHKCTITAPASVSIARAVDASVNRVFAPNVARTVVAQLVQGVAYLHSRGIVHSDLHTGNILLCLPKSIDTLTVDQFYDQYSRPKLEPIRHIDGTSLPDDGSVPEYAVIPVWLGKDSEKITLPEARILLTDFGESFMPSAINRYHSNTPGILKPPELYFQPDQPISFPSDIWTLACTIFSILGQRQLFEAWLVPDDDWMIHEHVDALGILPLHWWKKWEKRRKWFDEHGERTDGQTARRWEERFEYSVQEPRRECGMEVVSEEEKADLFPLLRSMLAYNPLERLTAEEVMTSGWMKKWAIPDLEVVRQVSE